LNPKAAAGVPAASSTALAEAVIDASPFALNQTYEQAVRVMLGRAWPPLHDLYAVEGFVTLGTRHDNGTYYEAVLADERGVGTPIIIRPGSVRGSLASGDFARAVGRIDCSAFNRVVRFRLDVIDVSCVDAPDGVDRPRSLGLEDLDALRSDRYAFPLRRRLQVAVICGRMNDVYDEFVDELKPDGDFVKVVEHRVAMNDAAAIATAIDEAQGDVLALIRGGGGDIDMAVFDTLPVLKAMAAKKCFRLLGVGHKKHRPLLALVADHATSTPTSAGAFIRNQLNAQGKLRWQYAQDAEQQLEARVRQQLAPVEQARAELARSLRDAEVRLEVFTTQLKARLDAPDGARVQLEGLVGEVHALRSHRRVLAWSTSALAVLLTIAVTLLVVRPSVPARIPPQVQAPPTPPAAAAPANDPVPPVQHGATKRGAHRPKDTVG